MFGKLATVAVVALSTLSMTAQAALAVDCRKPEEQSVLRNIESRGDAVLFDYFPNELLETYSVEYLNCRTNASISASPGTSSRIRLRFKDVIKTAIESPATYTRAQVIDAMKQKGITAKPGTLDNAVCACWEKVLKKSAKKWD